MSKEVYLSNVYTQRPTYADFDAPHKFEAIKAMIGKRLTQYPRAICSYSGGSDSDILLHLIESVRRLLDLPPVAYAFFNTGLEMEATKRHVREMAELYGVAIEERRPKKSIVLATREYGVPVLSKIMSAAMESWQRKGVPLSVKEEYDAAPDKPAKFSELTERYPRCKSVLTWLLSCNSAGEPRPGIQLGIDSSRYFYDFLKENPPQFKVSASCCDWCKKKVAHDMQKGYEMIITGERRDEGGLRSVPRSGDANGSMCFAETSSGQYRLRPLYYVSDADKQWYKDYYGLRYSDAYEVYGFKRTGCCGCSISARATDDLEKLRPYEPNLVKAAYNVFGDSYRYRQQYNEYKARRSAEEQRREDAEWTS